MGLIGDSAVRAGQVSPLGKSSKASILWLLYTSAAMMCAGTVRAQYTGDYQTNIISGVTSNWSGDYVVGSGSANHSPFDVLLIQNGGALSDGTGCIGPNYNNNNFAMVSGNGSTWNNSGDLFVGQSSSYNQLIITNGGAVYDNTGHVGVEDGTERQARDSVLVVGSGSVWSNRNDLSMQLGSSTLTIADGGAVYNNNATIDGVIRDSVLVTDTGSVWSIHGTLTMDSNNGTMTVSAGGFVHCLSGTILGFRPSALVTGPRSIWIVDSSLNIGGLGSSLTIADQGMVSAADGVHMSGPTRINILGGTLYVTNATVTAALTATSDGTVTLNSGTLMADALIAANVTFNGGVLRTKATAINSDSGFAVGDCADVATFILDSGGSGFHSFACGLTISSNAALRGVGTIIGTTVVNEGGVLAPGASPGSITFSNCLTLAQNSTFAVELDGIAEGQYDRIVALDTVCLSNSVLNVSLGFTPSVGDSFTIISNLGPSAVFGTFVDTQGDPLMNDDTFLLDGMMFEISYDGNANGQDVILTAVIPEPATWLLAALGIVVLYGSRRLRRVRCQS